MKLSGKAVPIPNLPDTNDHDKMPFGKYTGWLFENIPISYIKWALLKLDFSGKYAWLEEPLQKEFDVRNVK